MTCPVQISPSMVRATKNFSYTEREMRRYPNIIYFYPIFSVNPEQRGEQLIQPMRWYAHTYMACSQQPIMGHGKTACCAKKVGGNRRRSCGHRKCETELEIEVLIGPCCGPNRKTVVDYTSNDRLACSACFIFPILACEEGQAAGTGTTKERWKPWHQASRKRFPELGIANTSGMQSIFYQLLMFANLLRKIY